MRFFWRKEKKHAEESSIQDQYEAARARQLAEAELRDILNRQKEVTEVVNTSKRILARNHLGEAIESLFRQRMA